VREIIFEVGEDAGGGDFVASAVGFGIHTQSETLEELRTQVREVVDCYFEDGGEAPQMIRLRFVREEVLTR
jgi:predicted RNase H-like HicB family nuclease